MSKLVTPRKAIKTLESEKRLIKVSIDGEEIVNSYDLAISALEYRIPKKPKYFHKEHPYDSEECIVDNYYCPNCNEEINVYDSPNGCKFCLQTLDWSDEK